MLPLTASKKILGGNEAGVSLIETLVALALLSIIAVTFLSGLATTAKATFIADERATAESLARSQMEYVKSLEYVEYVDGATEYPSASIPQWLEDEDYSVTIGVEPLPSGDQSIQKIMVTVKHGDKTVLAVDGYKVDRYEAE